MEIHSQFIFFSAYFWSRVEDLICPLAKSRDLIQYFCFFLRQNVCELTQIKVYSESRSYRGSLGAEVKQKCTSRKSWKTVRVYRLNVAAAVFCQLVYTCIFVDITYVVFAMLLNLILWLF